MYCDLEQYIHNGEIIHLNSEFYDFYVDNNLDTVDNNLDIKNYMHQKIINHIKEFYKPIISELADDGIYDIVDCLTWEEKNDKLIYTFIARDSIDEFVFYTAE